MITKKSNRMMEIPNEFPTNGQDWANYIGHLWNANEQIQIVLDFEDKLDFFILKKAVRISIDAELILGCKFVEAKSRPFWHRLKDIDTIEWCTIVEILEKEEAIEQILSQPFDSIDYQLKVIVVRSNKSDTLCIKLNHACCDGGGAKDYLHLLSNIYNNLCNDINYIPKINIGNRDTTKLFQVLGVNDPNMLFDPRMTSLKPTWAFPNKEVITEKFNYSICRLDKIQTDHLLLFTKENDITLNDLILTAFYRTMFHMVKPKNDEVMEICVTIDLRRYLPEKKADAICNLSGVVNHRIANMEGENSYETLKRVSLVMKDIKNSKPGLHSAASMEIMAGLEFENAVSFIKNAWDESVKSRKSTINLSNFGIIAEFPMRFGNTMIKDAYMLTPVFRSPSFMLGVSNYNNILTFTVGYCEPEIEKDTIKAFFLMLKKELLSFIEKE